jgi:hypothetical protein
LVLGSANPFDLEQIRRRIEDWSQKGWTEMRVEQRTSITGNRSFRHTSGAWQLTEAGRKAKDERNKYVDKVHCGANATQSIGGHFLHNFDNGVLYLLRHWFQLRLTENFQQGSWPKSSQNSFASLLVHRDSAGQHSGDAHVSLENLFGLLRLTHLKNQAFTDEFDSLFRHRFFEVVDLHDAKTIGLSRDRQCRCDLSYVFVSG